MQTDNRIFDDLSRIAGGAFSTLAGVRDEVESRLREQLERVVERLNLVTREEFDAVAAMAARAREQNEALEARLAALELQLAAQSADRPAEPESGRAAVEHN